MGSTPSLLLLCLFYLFMHMLVDLYMASISALRDLSPYYLLGPEDTSFKLSWSMALRIPLSIGGNRQYMNSYDQM